MVVLAALPGMVKRLLVTGKIVDPGNFGATVNSLGSQLRKAGLALLTRTFTFELAPAGSPRAGVEYDYVGKQSIPTTGLSPASPTALWAASPRGPPMCRKVSSLYTMSQAPL